jgi:hypothetical protein
VEIKIYAKQKLPETFVNSLIEEIKYRYNFDLDLTDFYETFSEDKILAPILKNGLELDLDIQVLCMII